MKVLVALLAISVFAYARGGGGSHGSGASAGSAHATSARCSYTRSPIARQSFMRANPCPSTGRTYGPCRGYIVDHVNPLACGGADEPGNMSWQTTADAKAKDKWELNGCKGGRRYK